jgi:CHAT domain-containing protein/Tfp pilus assembly protein PilF
MSLLVISVAGCSSTSEPQLQRLHDSATAQLWRGELTDASRQAKEGATLVAAAPTSAWAWKFKLLAAEIRLVSRELAEAAAQLKDSPPQTKGFESIAAKHRYLQGQLALLQGRLPEALAILDQAQQLAQRASAVDVALDIRNMRGQALILQQNWQEAEAELNETIEQARGQRDRYREAVALLNLGTSHLFRDRFDHALQFFERILADKNLAPWLVHSVALANAGICYYRLGEIDRAIDAQTRAVASHQGPGRPRVYYARALGELGTTYLVKADTKNAIANLRRALDVAKDANLSADAARWASNLALAHIRLGEWEKAEALNEESRRLGGDRPDLAGYYISYAAEIALGRGRSADAARLFDQSVALAKDRPSLQWSAYEGLGRLAIAGKKPKEAERHFEATLAVIEQTRSDLLKADYRLSFLTRLLGFYAQYVDLLVDQGNPERALAIADSSRGRVLAERQGVAAPLRNSPADLRRTAAQLDAVLLFYWLGDRSYVWQVTANRIRLVPLSVSASQADALVQKYQQAIVTSLSDPLATPSSPGDEIFAKLVAPAIEGVTSGRRVVIVPDGALSRINFETLPVPGARRHYWIEDVEVAVAPSLGSLSASPQRKGLKRDRSVLLIGNPVSSDPEFPQLRFASAEMDAVSKAFAGRTMVYSADRATPTRYREAMPDQFGVVHFTAHASANAESPLDSAVILSKDGTGYKLYARDVAEQPLSAYLVTISACRSAGERTYAGEGLVGFAWAFLRAGAQRVIAGLWDVDDRSTADLMGRVYADIAQGHSPSTALRAAKLAMIARGGPISKPYYWGPFQLFIGSRVTP